MAAAEYYNPGRIPPQSQPHAPMVNNLVPPGAQHNPPYPMFDGPPPPYSPNGQARPHSQPPPQQRVRFDTNTEPNIDTHQYPPEKLPQQPQQQRPAANHYRVSDYPASRPPIQHQPQQPALPPNVNGYYPQSSNTMSQIHGGQPAPQRRYSSTPGAYQRYGSSSRSRSRSHSRSRSRDRRRHRRNHENRVRPQVTRKKSSGVNTFLGAGGGAIVGDLIFPGLGTLGGAILGGLGGHEYGKQRTDYAKDSSRGGISRSYNDGDRGYYYDDDHKRGRR